jgi:hypothetical protein
VDASDATHCAFTREDGVRCAGRVRPPARLCYLHDPEQAESRLEARRQGGRERSRPAAVLPPDTADAPLRTPADVRDLLGRTANQTLRGEVDPRVCNSVVYALSTLLRSIEGDEILRRIEALESRARLGARR